MHVKGLSVAFAALALTALPMGAGPGGLELAVAWADNARGAAVAQERANERARERANERSALGRDLGGGDLEGPEQDYEEVGAESADVEGEEDVEE